MALPLIQDNYQATVTDEVVSASATAVTLSVTPDSTRTTGHLYVFDTTGTLVEHVYYGARSSTQVSSMVRGLSLVTGADTAGTGVTWYRGYVVKMAPGSSDINPIKNILNGTDNAPGVIKNPSARTISDNRHLVDKEYADGLTVSGLTGLKVSQNGASPSTTFNVEAGVLRVDGANVNYAGAAAQALTTSATNYVYLTRAGVLTVNTTGFVVDSIPLATIVVTTEITSVTDKRQVITSDVTVAHAAALAGTSGVDPSASDTYEDLSDTTTALYNIDQRFITAQDVAVPFGKATGTTGFKIAQTFVATRPSLTEIVIWKLAETSNPTGNVVIGVYAVNASHNPTGSAIGSEVTVTDATFTAMTAGRNTISGFGITTLVPGTEYAIQFSVSAGDSNTDYRNIGGIVAGGYSSGALYAYNGTTWAASVVAADIYFETHYDPASKLVRTNSSGKIPGEFVAQQINELVAGESLSGATLPVPTYVSDGTGSRTSGSLYQSDANDTANGATKFHGFVTQTITSGAVAKLITSGVVGGFSGLTQGAKYYVSDTVGTIAATPGTVIVPVGVAVSTTQILIMRDKRISTGTATRLASAGTGSQAITGVGFRPEHITILAHRSGDVYQGFSVGEATSTSNEFTTYVAPGVSAQCICGVDSTHIVAAMSSSGSTQFLSTATISSIDADGFTLNWDANPTGGSGTITFHWTCVG